VILLLVSGFLFACSTEKKLAKEFVYNPVKRSALVIPPDYLFKYNRKEWLLDSIDGDFTDEQKDSLLWEMSQLVKNIDDSIYILKFIRGYDYQLAEYGFDVFPPSFLSVFLDRGTESYVITIPQIELEETVFPYKDETIFNGYTYFHQHYLNALSVSTWFEIKKINDTVLNYNDVLFAGDVMTDDLRSNFEYDGVNDEIRYFYQIDTLKVNDVYNLAVILGKRYARYTYDYILNDYILRNIQQGDTLKHYWHYDLERNKIYPLIGEEYKFIPLD
jgi:hypothetical protein